MNEEHQALCPNCGRGYTLNNIGTSISPIYVVPVHTTVKGNGNSVQCKGSNASVQVFQVDENMVIRIKKK